MSRFSTYAAAETFLLGFVNYESQRRWPVYDTTNFDLERFAHALERLGAPHRRPGLIHVAGTKGKGSVCALLSAILTAADLRTGLYLSPHIEGFWERIRINGAPISPEAFARLAGEVCDQIAPTPPVGSPEPSAAGYRTTFEILTAMAFHHFAKESCDAAVIETGLGGRLDATNVLTPALTVITVLGLDHQHILGHTLEAIAGEKAGIIKEGVPCILASQRPETEALVAPVVRSVAARRNAPLIRPNPVGAEGRDSVKILEAGAEGMTLAWRDLTLRTPLIGAHQADNIATALAAVEALRKQGWTIADEAIAGGLAATRLPGRCEVVQTDPVVILDGAHCPTSARATVQTVNTLWPERDVTVLYSALGDKNIPETLTEIGKLAHLRRVILYSAPSPRAAGLADLSAHCEALRLPAQTATGPAEALQAALRDAHPPNDLLLATGTLYTLAPLRQTLERRHNENSYNYLRP